MGVFVFSKKMFSSLIAVGDRNVFGVLSVGFVKDMVFVMFP